MREIANYQSTNLRTLLLARGVKFRELAVALGISESHMNRVINGERMASEQLAKEICAKTEVDFLAAFELTERSRNAPQKERLVPA